MNVSSSRIRWWEIILIDTGIAPLAPFPEYPGSPAHALYNKFDPASQLVSTSGDNAYADPLPGQIRGPCAGYVTL